MKASDTVRFFPAAPRFCGMAVSLAGIASLVGWMLWIPPVTGQWVAGMVPMSPITSLLFVVLGCAIVIAPRPPEPTSGIAAAVLAAAVAAIGGLRLADIAFGWNSHFDQWLFHDKIAAHGLLSRVSMAPRTALCFMGVGVGLVLFARGRASRPRVGQWPVIASMLMAVMAMFGHFYHALSLYEMTGFLPMALETSIVFLIAAGGILTLRPDQGIVGILASPNMGGAMARQLCGAVIILPPLLGLMCLELMRGAGLNIGDGVGLLVTLTGLLLATAVLISAHRLEKTADALTERGRELEIARLEAEGANRIKSVFLANMSHELRTPLNAVIGFSEIMRDARFGPMDSRYREYSGDIHASGVHLLSVVNQILDLAKIEAGQMTLGDDEIELSVLAASCLTLVREKAKAGGVTLVLEMSADLPLLRADETRMRQILVNLLSNAVKFTRYGGSVTLGARVDPKLGLEISVADTGIGMTEREVAIALLPFRQVESSLSSRYQGTGLGLPLAKALVEQHGGAMTLESSPGVGTTVRIQLPQARLLGIDAEMRSALTAVS
jgi:signal transduction histidine kinase